MAVPVVSGSLALLMEAFPGLNPDEYKTILIEMAAKTADTRAPKDENDENGDINDDSGSTSGENVTKFDNKKPILDFSNFKAPVTPTATATPAATAAPSVTAVPSATAAPGSAGFNWFFDFFGSHEMPGTGFSALRPQILFEKPLSVQYKPTNMTIKLPKLDVKSDIVTVPSAGTEYPVEWLGDAVGMLEGSSLPGEGFTVLTGHNHLNTTEAGPFALLFELEAGDRLMITDKQGIMRIWQVYENVKVASDGFSRISDDVKENSLALITCEDESVGGGYLNRRIILAEPAS